MNKITAFFASAFAFLVAIGAGLLYAVHLGEKRAEEKRLKHEAAVQENIKATKDKLAGDPDMRERVRVHSTRNRT